MGYIADEPLGDLLDEQGLDHAGKSLREQQRRAQAIDRDLPETAGGISWGEDDSPFPPVPDIYKDLMRKAGEQRKAIKDAMRMNPKWAMCPGKSVIGSIGPYASLNDKELEQEFHNAKARGNDDLAYRLANEARRRQQEKNDASLHSNKG